MAVSLWGGNMTLNCDISRTSWHMEVSDGSFFWIFHALSFEPNLYLARNSPLKEYNEYRQIVDEIDHMSDLHLDSSFYKRSMELDKYVKIEEWFDSSLGQSTIIQRLDLKKPTLSKQTQNKRKYVNFENGSHFICSFNLNNPETTVCIVFKMTNIASGDQLFVNSLIGR